MRLSTLALWSFLCTVFGSNILGLFPTTAKSAFLASEAIMKGLAARGHNVTVVSCFPQKTPIKNYTDISLRHLRVILESSLDFKKFDFPLSSILDLTWFFVDLIKSMEELMKSKELLALLNSNVTFDVVFHEMFVDNVFFLYAKKFKAPLIAVGPSYILPWAADRFGIPQNPAYIPVIGTSFSKKMDFYERLKNTLINLKSKWDYWNEMVPKSVEVFETCFPKDKIPSMKDAVKDISMYFVNTHFSFLGARPLPPQVVEIGGIHVQLPQPLSQDLSEWLDDAVHGVVYMSFGSMLRSASLPQEKAQVFFRVLGRLPQRVLVKWEEDEGEEVPSNLRLMKWLPQRDVLNHPKVQLFISHGGLLGTTEAAASGVPVLGIPTNMDQANNVAALVDAGVALYLSYANITEDSLFYCVNKLLTDSSYSENARQLSRRFLDRPQSPLDTAVYWTEYVIRHRGAPHLQSAAVHMPWYQYMLLDVVVVLLTALVFILAVIYYVLRAFFRCLLSKKLSKLKKS